MEIDQPTLVEDSRPRANLTVAQGSQIGLSIPLLRDQVVIGRGLGADIIVQDAEVSKLHACISWIGGRFVIEDKTSTNGTFVNGTQITKSVVLSQTDKIRLGQTVLILHISEAHMDDKTVVHPTGAGIIDKSAAEKDITFGFEQRDMKFTEQGIDADTAITLAERFRPVLVVASGGMGKIFLVQELLSGRYVALKAMLESVANDASLIQQFVREAVITARLQHPCIIPVYELGFLSGTQLYYTMRFVDGHAFNALIDRVTLEERLRILRSAALAVDHAHAHGLWHRDLKPSNILVGEQGDTYVTDWGLVSILPGCKYELNLPRIVVERAAYVVPDRLLEETKDAITATGEIMGTPAYMAPEQVMREDDRMGIGSDVWAFGIMLFEAITGRHPIKNVHSLHPLEILQQVVSIDFPSPKEVEKQTPVELNDLCQSMLIKDAAKRMQTLKECVAGISQYLGKQEETIIGFATSPRFQPTMAETESLQSTIKERTDWQRRVDELQNENAALLNECERHRRKNEILADALAKLNNL